MTASAGLDGDQLIATRYLDAEPPELTVERTIDAGDVVVVTGTGIGHHRENGRFRFAYGDLFTFRDSLIAQVDSYVVPLS